MIPATAVTSSRSHSAFAFAVTLTTVIRLFDRCRGAGQAPACSSPKPANRPARGAPGFTMCVSVTAVMNWWPLFRSKVLQGARPGPRGRKRATTKSAKRKAVMDMPFNLENRFDPVERGDVANFVSCSSTACWSLTRLQQRGALPEKFRRRRRSSLRPAQPGRPMKHFPFTVKNDLRDNYPFGMIATPMRDVVRVHAAAGPPANPPWPTPRTTSTSGPA